MNLNLFGKNALVCGSSRGIGKASAIQLASLGANVTLVSRSPDIMSSVIMQMDIDTERDQDHDFLAADFSKSEELRKKMMGLALKRNYHILVNNTGGPPGGPITEATVDQFHRAFEQHLLCNHILVQSLKDGMKKEGYGRIINVISTSVKAPLDNLGVSNTIRGAVASWAKTMANELGPYGITVNNVLPGYTDTQRLKEIFEAKAKKSGASYEEVKESTYTHVPLRRIAQPEEIGAVVAFLASPAASYMTGTSIPVDGGRTRSI